MNLDESVGPTDLLALLGSWGACPVAACPLLDLDGDGVVAAGDLMALLANWGNR